MLAGFVGAFSSQFWFLAFALTAAANVRTLALVEVLFAQGVAYYSFKQPASPRELSGIALIVIGIFLFRIRERFDTVDVQALDRYRGERR